MPLLDGRILSSLVNSVIDRAVHNTLARQDVPIEMRDVAATAIKTTDAVITAIDANPTVAVVPVQSPIVSKTNWTQIVMFLLTMMTWLGIPIDDSTKLQVIEGLVAIGGLVTIIIKTYFTKSIASTSK